ncbi:MAG: hypothetical protein RQ756_07400 [Flavobacteriaceae bacterium]|nr:hypothetical protein [Flavobacteriaceae bacterium]
MKKEIFIGFLVGVLANVVGMFLYVQAFSKLSFESTIDSAIEQGFLGKIIVLGAIANVFPSFVFLKKNKIYRARGVLIATMMAALISLYFNF